MFRTCISCTGGVPKQGLSGWVCSVRERKIRTTEEGSGETLLLPLNNREPEAKGCMTPSGSVNSTGSPAALATSLHCPRKWSCSFLTPYVVNRDSHVQPVTQTVLLQLQCCLLWILCSLPRWWQTFLISRCQRCDSTIRLTDRLLLAGSA